MIFFLIKWKSTPAPPVVDFGTNNENVKSLRITKFGIIMIFFLIKWKSTPALPVAGFGTNAEYRQYSQICCLGICESRLGWDKLGFFLLACECFQRPWRPSLARAAPTRDTARGFCGRTDPTWAEWRVICGHKAGKNTKKKEEKRRSDCVALSVSNPWPPQQLPLGMNEWAADKKTDGKPQSDQLRKLIIPSSVIPTLVCCHWSRITDSGPLCVRL